MKSINIVIVDYGMGNLHSIARAIKYASPEANIKISISVQEINTADKIILPGQGAMKDCMLNLKESGIFNALINALKNKPLLGICVGQQMLFTESEEGNTRCLDIFDGEVKHFNNAYISQSTINSDNNNSKEKLKVPHMGWNKVHQLKDHFIWNKIPNDEYFYFTHSFYVESKDKSIVAGVTSYGIDFASAIAKDNIFTTQFHPEKSSKYGLILYKNFIEWKP